MTKYAITMERGSINNGKTFKTLGVDNRLYLTPDYAFDIIWDNYYMLYKEAYKMNLRNQRIANDGTVIYEMRVGYIDNTKGEQLIIDHYTAWPVEIDD